MIKKKEVTTEVEVKSTEVAETKKSLPPTSKSFLEVEEPELYVDILKVDNWPPQYTKKWCKKEKMPSGRSGNWVTVDKKHPDFKGIRPVIDHTPEQSFVTNGDLILCCMRKETHDKLTAHRNEVAKRAQSKAKDTYNAELEKLKSNLGRKGDLRIIE